MGGVTALYDKIVDPGLLIRRLNLTACRVLAAADVPQDAGEQQLSLFTDLAAEEEKKAAEEADLEKERQMQQAMLDIKKKFGKNSILKAMNLEDGATAIDRNNQIGGHKA